jgi:murein DD-endopeptidase MepM/ murein hydrolase activator NlpD
MTRPRLRVSEIFGIAPIRARLAEARLAIRGDRDTPKTRWDRTSLSQLWRLSGPRIWAGQRPYGRLVPISNLVNHTPTPVEQGWSTRITQVSDFRGDKLTYDSHNGTDFATPVGTQVTAAAPGVVRRISREFNRAGLKIFIDHGDGLGTTSNHLARALVEVGERVVRGQVIALSGYSGIDGFVTFPWGIPHVHWNVWLDGRHVDPFAAPGETPLWITGNEPRPFLGNAAEAAREPLPPSDWDAYAIARGVASCRSPESVREIESHDDLGQRAFAYMFHTNYYPTRFGERPSPYASVHPRRPRLDLPFLAADYDGVAFPPA